MSEPIEIRITNGPHLGQVCVRFKEDGDYISITRPWFGKPAVYEYQIDWETRTAKLIGANL